MAHLSKGVLASLFVLALAACQGGGGGQSAMPPASTLPAASNPTMPQSSNILAAAPQGVRAFMHLPIRNSGELDKLIEQQGTKNSPLYHHWLTPAQFRSSFGPTASDLNLAASTLKSAGFQTTITSQGLVADAPQAVVERTFGIRLSTRTISSKKPGEAAQSMLVANRKPVLPEALARIGANVAGFAAVRPMQSTILKVQDAGFKPSNRNGPTGFYWFDDLKQAYEYPSYNVIHGTGTTIAIVGVADWLQSDQDVYFGHEGLPSPTIIRRPVDGGPPPFALTGNALEMSADIEQSGGSAPGATLITYQGPNALITPTFMDIYTAIVEDNKADVVNTSFGLCELLFTAPYNDGVDATSILQDFHDIFRQGNAQGITFVESSGDNGALGCPDVAHTHAIFGVNSFVDDPDVTAVGGTNLVTSFIANSLRSTYVRENAFDDPFAPPSVSGELPGSVFGSGGGKSVIFSKPLYQFLVNTHASTRAVPDVSLHMGGCPQVAVQPCGPDRSSDIVALGGLGFGVIGTSLSAPEFAGLQALQDERFHSRAGNVNFLLYGLAAIHSVGNGPIFHNNIPGNNGYVATPGYNFVVGNGTVRGAQYVLDPFGPFANDPQTPSNP